MALLLAIRLPFWITYAWLPTTQHAPLDTAVRLFSGSLLLKYLTNAYTFAVLPFSSHCLGCTAGYSFFHLCVVASHSPPADTGAIAAACLSSFVRKSLASAHTGISTWIVGFFNSALSTSTIMTSAALAHVFQLYPVCLIDILVPTASIKSAFWIAQLPGLSPILPALPQYRGLSSSIRSTAFQYVTIGILSFSETDLNTS